MAGDLAREIHRMARDGTWRLVMKAGQASPKEALVVTVTLAEDGVRLIHPVTGRPTKYSEDRLCDVTATCIDTHIDVLADNILKLVLETQDGRAVFIDSSTRFPLARTEVYDWAMSSVAHVMDQLISWEFPDKEL